MKVFKIFIILLSISIANTFAANPGSNYGCEADFNHYTYTNWTQTFTASPNNPGWQATFQGYDEGGTVYSPYYNPGNVPCGQANPNNFQNAGQVCWVYRASTSTWMQGALKSWTPGSITPCNVPYDNYVPILIFFVGCLAYYQLRKIALVK
ncbi:MAG: hypothetical protein EOO42_21140 [Flavobacteriales bacterium]|nr:MAG: hypothetical protein EOO42_21140 [Flavobacteriales bacterium]